MTVSLKIPYQVFRNIGNLNGGFIQHHQQLQRSRWSWSPRWGRWSGTFSTGRRMMKMKIAMIQLILLIKLLWLMKNRDWRRLGNVDVRPFGNRWNLEPYHHCDAMSWLSSWSSVSSWSWSSPSRVKPAGVEHGEALEEQLEEAQEAPAVMEAGWSW